MPEGDDEPASTIYAFRLLARLGHWLTAGVALGWLLAMIVVSGTDPGWIGMAFWLSAAVSLLFILGSGLWYAAAISDGSPGALQRR